MNESPPFARALTALAFVSAALGACSSTGSPGVAKKDAGANGDAVASAAVEAGLMSLIGEACGSDADCVDGLKCAREDPGGQCFKDCAPSKDSDCGDPKLYACNFEGHCYYKCATDLDCARASEGYACKDDKPIRAGVKFCDVK